MSFQPGASGKSASACDSAVHAAPPPGKADCVEDALSPDGRRPRQRQLSISCVVPCRNEASNLALLLPRLAEVLGRESSAWEIILVDDGSVDATAACLAEWAERPGFRVIQLSRNFGKEASLTAGLQAARGEGVILMDADLQHPPELIPKLLLHWRRGADVVYAVRENRRDENWLKRAGARLFYRLVNAEGRLNMPRDAGDFRLLDRSAVDALLALPERNRFMKGLYAWIGFDAVGVPYEPPPRLHGRSHFSALRLLRHSIDGLTSFTTWPLRAASLMGVLLALLGFGYGAYLSLAYFIWQDAVSGWTTIVVGMALMLGFVLIALGVLGEYVGRIYEEVKARPLYVVKREIGRGLDHDRAPRQ